jgi:hypothetical protein
MDGWMAGGLVGWMVGWLCTSLRALPPLLAFLNPKAALQLRVAHLCHQPKVKDGQAAVRRADEVAGVLRGGANLKGRGWR